MRMCEKEGEEKTHDMHCGRPLLTISVQPIGRACSQHNRSIASPEQRCSRSGLRAETTNKKEGADVLDQAEAIRLKLSG